MTVAQQTPSQHDIQKSAAPPRNGRWSGFRHLLGARMLELVREKEVVFWVFVFPLLLALGLGFAFRNKPADRTTIAILAGPSAVHIQELIQSSPQKNAAMLSALDSKPTHHAVPPLPSYVASPGKCGSAAADRVDRHARRADQYTR